MSTERMNDNQGTARMDGGTDRMDAGTARMGAAAASPQKAGVVFASGQTIVLSGKNCVIDSTISMGSGEAVVYKVIIDGKPYALKLYKQETPLSDTAKKVITKIKDNPKNRIIRIYGFGKYNEQDFEIMEYAEGGTLDQYLKSNGAIHDTTKIKNIVKMITEGLEQLHSEYKVIYQDLKPENIYFRDAAKTSLVLADFGISSIMEGLDEKIEVTASVTDLYAAPELAHKGNTTKVMVTPSVDYFALGITMFELWLGEKPFKGVKAVIREDLITDEKVDFPIDMPDDYATIIRGLIRPQRKDRWGNEQVRKWLKGEALAIEPKVSQKASAAYDPLEFSSTESAASPKELAALMEKYPDIGKTCLYDGIIKEWFKKAGNLRLYNEIQNIASQYAQDKDAGLYTAILALDPEKPFKSRSGKICKTTEDIADAIMAESAYYMEDLKKPNANLYLYLAATEGSQGKEAADSFCNYFKEYSPKRALALLYLKLQGDGGITIGSKHYQSPDELKHEKDSAQITLIKKAVTEKDSILLVWLSDIYGDNLKSTDTFSKLNTLEQFFLLGLLPYLSFKEFKGNSWDALQHLIDSCPGRSDLFEIYAAQGLPLTGQGCSDKRTPIDYVVCNFKKLSKKHNADTIRNLIRLLHKLGADVDEYSGDGTCPLINVYNAEDNNLVKLLLELGADEKQYRVYKENVEERISVLAEIHKKIAKYQRCIAVGFCTSHTVGLKADGTVVAVGNNDYGQCNVSGWGDIVAIATGSGHTVGLKTDGTVVAVGENLYGQCNVSSWGDIVAIATGYYHTVGLKADGTVVAVGSNTKYDDDYKEVHCGQCDVSNWRDIIAIYAGYDYTVGLKTDGTVVAVGDNEEGQYNVSGWSDIVAVATGSGHTVGLKADGTVVAVGNNTKYDDDDKEVHCGQCDVSNWHDIVAVATGYCHTVGLKVDGTVVAVGDNKEGQCNVSNWRDIVAIAIGLYHTVGLKADGTVVAVGSNTKYDDDYKEVHCGQCDVSNWRDIIAIYAGYDYTVGLKTDGTVVVVGDNGIGLCDTGSWRDVGPVPEEQVLKWKQALKAQAEQEAREVEERRQSKAEQEAREAEERQRAAEQQRQWQAQGLCRYCGGKLGGLFTKKCKDCGREG